MMYEDNSDDESSGKAQSPPTMDCVFEGDDEQPATLCTAHDPTVGATVGTTVHDVTAKTDVPAAVHCDDNTSRTHSDRSDPPRSDPDHFEQNCTSHHSASPTSPHSSKVLPNNSTSNINPQASEILPVDSTPPDVARRPSDESHGNRQNSDGVHDTLGGTPNSSPKQLANDRETGAGDSLDHTASVETSQSEQVSRGVTMRRPSRPAISTAAAAAATTVVELHIDVDVTPTSVSDFQLDELSADSGSAVHQLRQFLDNDSSLGRQSTPSGVASAIQPGKAFDSLKYFLSTLD